MLVESLLDGASEETVAKSIFEIKSGGTEAFPALLDHINDKRLAKRSFFQQNLEEVNPDGSVKLTPEGKAQIHLPTIGDACLMILKSEIEGDIAPNPKFDILLPDSVRRWIEAHKGQTVAQMAESARKEHLARAEAMVALEPDKHYWWDAVKKYRTTAQEIQRRIAALTADGYAKVFETFVEGKSDDEVSKAEIVIREAGVEAYPALLAHLEDKRLVVENWFVSEKMSSDASGHFPRATVGGACFKILHQEIEGYWPLSYERFYAVRRDNVKQWVEAHKGQTLDQMSESALMESLRWAEAELALHPDDTDVKGAVEYLRERKEMLRRREVFRRYEYHQKFPY